MSSKKREDRKKMAWIAGTTLGLMFLGVLWLSIMPIYQDVKEQDEKTKFYEDFPGMETAASLSESARKKIIDKSNLERCSCECGYTLASCLKVDLGCPLRESNISKVKGMVTEAKTRKNS